MTRIIESKSHAEWLKNSSGKIGGSNSSTIAGCNKYGNIVKLYNEFLEGGIRDESNMNEAMLWGHAFESGVAELFCTKTGAKIINDSEREYQYISDDYDWLSYSPDREIMMPDGTIAFLECKTSVTDPELPQNNWQLKSWYCQNQHGMNVHKDIKKSFLACAVLGFERKFVIREWDADPEFQSRLFNLEYDFKACVDSHIPPMPRTKEEIDLLFPAHKEGVFAQADEQLYEVYKKLKFIKEKQSELAEQEIEYKSMLIAQIGDAEGLKFGDNLLCTYKKPKDRLILDEKSLMDKYPNACQKFMIRKPGSRTFLVK